MLDPISPVMFRRLIFLQELKDEIHLLEKNLKDIQEDQILWVPTRQLTVAEPENGFQKLCTRQSAEFVSPFILFFFGFYRTVVKYEPGTEVLQTVVKIIYNYKSTSIKKISNYWDYLSRMVV